MALVIHWIGSRLQRLSGRSGFASRAADLLLADLIPDHPVRLLDVEGMRWAEIDDAADLEAARRVFHSRPVTGRALG